MLLHRNPKNLILFREKRMVFGADGGGEVIDLTGDAKKVDATLEKRAIEAALADQSLQSAGDVLAKALAAVDSLTVAVGADVEKSQAAAKESLKQNSAELQKAIEFITAKTQAKTLLVRFDISDFWTQGDMLKKVEPLKAALKNFPNDLNIEGKEGDYKAAAKSKYEAMTAPELPIDSKEKLQKCISSLTLMAKAKAAGFPGLEGADVEATRGKVDAAMTATSDALNGASDELRGDPEIARQIEMLNDVSVARGAAKESGNEGQKAGSEMYMNMFVAEQEARDIRSQLTADILKDRKSEIDLGDISLAEGVKLSASAKGSGKYQDAIDKFHDASEWFKKNLNIQKGREKDDGDRAEYLATNPQILEAKAALESGKKKLQGLANYSNGDKFMQNAQASADPIEKEAVLLGDKGDYKGAIDKYKEAATVYEYHVGFADQMTDAISQFRGTLKLAGIPKTSDESDKTLKALLPATMPKGLSGVLEGAQLFTGTYLDQTDQKLTYSVSIVGGKWQVKTNILKA